MIAPSALPTGILKGTVYPDRGLRSVLQLLRDLAALLTVEAGKEASGMAIDRARTLALVVNRAEDRSLYWQSTART